MLNEEIFELDKGFKMLILTAYYTSDGFRIDQNDVKPDVETPSKDALLNAFSEIIKSEPHLF